MSKPFDRDRAARRALRLLDVVDPVRESCISCGEMSNACADILPGGDWRTCYRKIEIKVFCSGIRCRYRALLIFFITFVYNILLKSFGIICMPFAAGAPLLQCMRPACRSGAPAAIHLPPPKKKPARGPAPSRTA
jgi:hypothetical protein